MVSCVDMKILAYATLRCAIVARTEDTVCSSSVNHRDVICVIVYLLNLRYRVLECDVGEYMNLTALCFEYIDQILLD